jgi:hypothetical protein
VYQIIIFVGYILNHPCIGQIARVVIDSVHSF